MREATIGFGAANQPAPDEEKCLMAAQTRDFIEFGFEPEFIGRLPIRVVCHHLSVDDLFEILKMSEGSIIRQYEQTFAAYGIEVLFQDGGLRRIAELAAEERTGARGLMTVCEGVFRDFKFELPSSSVKHFEVTRALVDDPGGVLKKVLSEQATEERKLMGQVVHEFASRFSQEHGLIIRFTEEAVDWLIGTAQARAIPVRDLCAVHFKDFQFGLKLIATNIGQKEYVIDRAAAEAPDKILSDWVVASYRQRGEAS
jgi:hypothetical protein